MPKYDPLHAFLAGTPLGVLDMTISFWQIEEILGARLPGSARRHRAWWANYSDPNQHPQAQAWLSAGWMVDQVERYGEWVRFQRLTPEPRKHFRRTRFSTIWKRIVAQSGETFQTHRGLNFTYTVDEKGLRPSRTVYHIPQIDFEEAYRLVPLAHPAHLSTIVAGPAFVWAILHDRRISQGAW